LRLTLGGCPRPADPATVRLGRPDRPVRRAAVDDLASTTMRRESVPTRSASSVMARSNITWSAWVTRLLVNAETR
jgi:hypothetical protein